MNRQHLSVHRSLRGEVPGCAPEREAVAVISAARGCSQDAAFDELIDVAMHHHVSVGSAAASLISLVRESDLSNGAVIVPPQWAELRKARNVDARTVGTDA